MKWITCVATAAAIALPSGVNAQGGDVTIDEFLDRVRSTHPFFKAERLQPAAPVTMIVD